jgi:hypothetical protein
MRRCMVPFLWVKLNWFEKFLKWFIYLFFSKLETVFHIWTFVLTFSIIILPTIAGDALKGCLRSHPFFLFFIFLVQKKNISMKTYRVNLDLNEVHFIKLSSYEIVHLASIWLYKFSLEHDDVHILILLGT